MMKRTQLEPSEFPRRVLLAACGLSPQVVTETLYALTQKNKSPYIPTEICLITTTEGAKRAKLSLLSDSPGGFSNLIKDYSLPDITFNDESFLIVPNVEGKPLDDIRTPQDNESCANYIADTVRHFTSDQDCSLQVSIAGGRKTMGFFLGYALSLFGRSQDRLSHVLVSEPYESSWNFFYPTPYSQVIKVTNNQLVDTAEAKVVLADIPFVRLRQSFSEDYLEKASTFNQSIDEVSLSLSTPELTMHIGERLLWCSGQKVHLPPRQMTLYFALVKNRKEGGNGLHYKDGSS